METPLKEEEETPELPVSIVKEGVSRQLVVCNVRRGPPLTTRSAGTWILDFPGSRTVRIIVKATPSVVFLSQRPDWSETGSVESFRGRCGDEIIECCWKILVLSGVRFI